MVAFQRGQHQSAIDSISKAIAIKDSVPEFHSNLGEAYRALGRLDDAAASYRRALALNPDLPEALLNLGIVLGEQGLQEEAVAYFRRAVEVRPHNAGAHNNLGIVLGILGKLEEAVVSFRQALAVNPAFAVAHNNLGNTLKDQGRLEEAEACYRRALALKPDYASAHSNLLFAMYCNQAYDADVIAAEHIKWNDVHAAPLVQQRKYCHSRPGLDRPLRVGYVSADFRGHAIGFFIEPLLAAHDPARVEVFCYSNSGLFDERTQRFKDLSQGWRSIIGFTDDAVADLIRADGIDILVDLSSHTAGNRLLVFARKPAPVQVAYMGSAMTTGLTTMDYRLTDRFLSPPDTSEWSSEELIRLPGFVACYQPPADAPGVAPLPVLANGYVTFGCFNNLVKVTPVSVALWARILRALPTARLILKNRSLADAAQRARYLGLFRDNGIEAERIELLPHTPMAEYLATYGRVDIALDPFPYTGCTTTLEALWMGVPVVTLAGILANGRMGVTLLSNLGLDHLIATTSEEYVKITVELATNRQALETLRAGLRLRMAASPLCDAKALARAVEEAYRKMWRRWCERQELMPTIPEA